MPAYFGLTTIHNPQNKSPLDILLDSYHKSSPFHKTRNVRLYRKGNTDYKKGFVICIVLYGTIGITMTNASYLNLHTLTIGQKTMGQRKQSIVMSGYCSSSHLNEFVLVVNFPNFVAKCSIFPASVEV